MKTKFILGFSFILITLVGLNNTHVLNYTRNVIKILCIPNTRKRSQAYFQGLYQTSENKIVFHKFSLKNYSIFRKR